MAIEHAGFRVAAAQGVPALLELDATIEKALALLEKAARHGAAVMDDTNKELLLEGGGFARIYAADGWRIRF
ncbi:hypothetical protein [Arhodomonas sp. SL1]|uniref:hypothetical protein n=1 Tax=Arhodomonas sp. SL1 TaxID=3425691 RepID=UPI003F882C80